MILLARVLFITLAIFAGSTQATVITTNGSTVSFSYDDTLLDLFGTPIITGDSIVFTPTNFKAQAVNSSTLGFGSASVTTKVTITPLAGYQESSISLTERGDYNQMSLTKNPASASEVGVAGQIRALNTNTLNEVTSAIQPSAAFAPTGTTSNRFATTNWTANASVNVSGFHSSPVILTIENLLFAVAPTLGDYAFIEKKYAGITVTTTASAVPLPAAVWLFGAALFGFLSVSKRKNQL